MAEKHYSTAYSLKIKSTENSDSEDRVLHIFDINEMQVGINSL